MFKFVIVGGGTAGWLSALTINKLLPYSEVTVVASSEIGILGAGEGTTPHFIKLIEKLDLPEKDFFEHCKSTYKHSINFFNWNGDNTEYVHPFPENTYAIHFDARLVAEYLKNKGIERGVRYIDSTVCSINDNLDGSIKSITIANGEELHGDFFIDCSGLKRLIIGNHYKTEWISYEKYLPAKRAIPFFIPREDDDTQDYTGAIAMKNGWVWKIPVQGRFGCGYVFDTDFCTDEEAVEEIKELFGDVTIPTKFDYRPGCYEKTWVHNCIAIGLSAGFTEPMEATSIWIQVQSLEILVLLFKRYIRDGIQAVDYYNSGIREMNNQLMGFIHLHYLTKRDDSEFWRTFKENNSTPAYLLKIRDMINSGEFNNDTLKDTLPLQIETLFPMNSWMTVGQGVGYFG